jgi:hypothetical protein
LQEYALVDSETMAFAQRPPCGIELFRKTGDDNWRIIDYEPGDVVELTSIKLTFPIELVYEDIVLTTVKGAEISIDE